MPKLTKEELEELDAESRLYGRVLTGKSLGLFAGGATAKPGQSWKKRALLGALLGSTGGYGYHKLREGARRKGSKGKTALASVTFAAFSDELQRITKLGGNPTKDPTKASWQAAVAARRAAFTPAVVAKRGNLLGNRPKVPKPSPGLIARILKLKG